MKLEVGYTIDKDETQGIHKFVIDFDNFYSGDINWYEMSEDEQDDYIGKKFSEQVTNKNLEFTIMSIEEIK